MATWCLCLYYHFLFGASDDPGTPLTAVKSCLKSSSCHGFNHLGLLPLSRPSRSTRQSLSETGNDFWETIIFIIIISLRLLSLQLRSVYDLLNGLFQPLHPLQLIHLLLEMVKVALCLFSVYELLHCFAILDLN